MRSGIDTTLVQPLQGLACLSHVLSDKKAIFHTNTKVTVQLPDVPIQKNQSKLVFII
ncbi:MAG: hypothetical protein WDZ94_04005 [Patescibacteria group bacterium]